MTTSSLTFGSSSSGCRRTMSLMERPKNQTFASRIPIPIKGLFPESASNLKPFLHKAPSLSTLQNLLTTFGIMGSESTDEQLQNLPDIRSAEESNEFNDEEVCDDEFTENLKTPEEEFDDSQR